MKLIVEFNEYSIEDLKLGDRILIAGHITKVEQERFDVAGFYEGRRYEESAAGEMQATFTHDAILAGRWRVTSC